MKEEYSFDTVKDIFTKYLEDHKNRKTPERFAILEQIYAYEGHFNAEDLFNTMQEDYRVSLATVYNTLELLLKCQLIIKHQFGGQLAQYEKSFGVSSIHHHLICTRCGAVKEFSDKKIRTAIQNKKFAQFNTTHYSLYLYGCCKKCRQEIKKSKERNKQ